MTAPRAFSRSRKTELNSLGRVGRDDLEFAGAIVTTIHSHPQLAPLSREFPQPAAMRRYSPQPSTSRRKAPQEMQNNP